MFDISGKDIVLLILGGLLGLIPILFKFLIKAYKALQVKIRRSLTKKIDKWLIAYYRKNNALNDLYDCRINNFETKIPFISKKSWQKFFIVDSGNPVLDYVKSDNTFPVKDKLLNKRKKMGQVLFDEPTLFLDRIDKSAGSHVRLHTKSCMFKEMASNLISLEEETYKAIFFKSLMGTPIRNKYFRNLETIEKLSHKPFSLGCAATLVLKTNDGWELMIHTRSAKTITYGERKAVIPNFGFSIPNDDFININLITYNFIREYCEELFNCEELIKLNTSYYKDPCWFLNKLSYANDLQKLENEGKFQLYFTGFGFDALNGTCIISLAAIINDVASATKIKKDFEDANKVKSSWEIATYNEIAENYKTDDENQLTFKKDRPLIQYINYQDEILVDWLRKGMYHCGGAFSIARAIQLLNET